MRSPPPRDVQAVWRKYGYEHDVYLSQILLANLKKKKNYKCLMLSSFSKDGAQENSILGKTYKTNLLLGWSWEGLG